MPDLVVNCTTENTADGTQAQALVTTTPRLTDIAVTAEATIQSNAVSITVPQGALASVPEPFFVHARILDGAAFPSDTVRDSEGGEQPLVRDATATTSVSVLSPANGSTLTGSTYVATFSARDGYNYDVWVGSELGGRQYHDSTGLANSGASPYTVTGVPQNGTQVFMRIFEWPVGGVVADGTFADVTYTANTTSSTADFSKRFDFSGSNIEIIDQSDNSTLAMNFGSPSSRVTLLPGGIMQAQIDPVTAIGGSGSTREIFGRQGDSFRRMKVSQEVRVLSPFDPASVVKAGFGLGGNMLVSGGNRNPCGWTMRWEFDDGEWVGYSYALDRAGAFGDVINTGVFVQPDRWYLLEMEVLVNTGAASDGTLRQWIDGVEVVNRTGIQWMNHTDPSCSATENRNDYCFISLFYGGQNNTVGQFSPSSTQFFQYRNVVYEGSNA